MKKKKELFFIATLAMLLAFCFAGSAIAAESKPDIKNVKFVSGGQEVFVLPAPGANQLSAKLYMENAAPQQITLIMAAYADDTLESVSIAANTDIIEGYPTVESPKISVTKTTQKVKLLVWNDLEGVHPIAQSNYTLSAVSRDARLDQYSVTLTDNSVTTPISKTFVGDINHDAKTVDVLVPTMKLDQSQVTKAETKAISACVPAVGYETTFSAAYYDSAAQVAQCSAQAVSGTTNESTVLDLTQPKYCRVTAPDGTYADYKINLINIGYLLDGSFNKTRLAYPGVASAQPDNYLTLPSDLPAEEAWKFENNNFAKPAWALSYPSIMANRALAPSATLNAFGNWCYTSGFAYNGGEAIKNSDNIVTGYRGGWRYLKEDWLANNQTAANYTIGAVPFSYIYADLPGNSTAEFDADSYMNIVSPYGDAIDGVNPGTGSIAYRYDCQVSDFTNNIDVKVDTFKFKLSKHDGTGKNGIRYNNGTCEFAIRFSDDTHIRLDARVDAYDGSFNGKTAETGGSGNIGYTNMNVFGLNADQWYNVKMLTYLKENHGDGTQTIVTDYYIDGEYTGYTYATNVSSKMYNYLPTFYRFYYAQCELGIDDIFTGAHSSSASYN